MERLGRPSCPEEKYLETLFTRIGNSVDVDWDTGCWLWNRSRFKNGYGQFKVRELGVWKTRLAHSVIYQLFCGIVPVGRELDHLCRVKHCVNPYHLEAVEHKINSRRAIGIYPDNPRKTHCKRGHLYSEENLTHYEGRNRCRLCRNERSRLHYRVKN